MTIDLSPDTARLVQEAVSSGAYPDANAVVEAAVHGWTAQRDKLQGFTPEEITRLWDEGIASGPGRDIDFEEIKREVRRRAAVSNVGA